MDDLPGNEWTIVVAATIALAVFLMLSYAGERAARPGRAEPTRSLYAARWRRNAIITTAVWVVALVVAIVIEVTVDAKP